MCILPKPDTIAAPVMPPAPQAAKAPTQAAARATGVAKTPRPLSTILTGASGIATSQTGTLGAKTLLGQ